MKQLLAVLWLALVALATPAAAQTFPANNGSPVVDQAGISAPGAGGRPQVQVRGAVRADRTSLRGGDRQKPRRLADRRLRLSARAHVGTRRRRTRMTASCCWSRPTSARSAIATGYGAGEYHDRRDVGDHHPRGDPAALQAEPARLWRRHRGRRRCDHQADEPAARRSAKNVAAGPAGTAGAQASSRWFVAGHFLDHDHRVRHPVDVRGAQAAGATAAVAAGISPWVVLWGLNELSRGSRGGGWGGGSSWSGGGWGGGGGGGGFGGFGGGSFGGGGASGSW